MRSLWTDISLRKRRERLSDSLRQWVVSNQHSPNPEEVLSVREQDQTIVDPPPYGRNPESKRAA